MDQQSVRLDARKQEIIALEQTIFDEDLNSGRGAYVMQRRDVGDITKLEPQDTGKEEE